jgi:hypothetical protein
MVVLLVITLAAWVIALLLLSRLLIDHVVRHALAAIASPG